MQDLQQPSTGGGGGGGGGGAGGGDDAVYMAPAVDTAAAQPLYASGEAEAETATGDGRKTAKMSSLASVAGDKARDPLTLRDDTVEVTTEQSENLGSGLFGPQAAVYTSTMGAVPGEVGGGDSLYVAPGTGTAQPLYATGEAQGGAAAQATTISSMQDLQQPDTHRASSHSSSASVPRYATVLPMPHARCFAT